MSFLDFLNPLKIITGPLESITKAIASVQLEKARAQTDEKRINAEERVKTLEAKRDVLIAESGDKINRLVRALMAIPVVILLWKLIVFDNVFGQWLGWATPQLSDDLWYIVLVVIGFYFVDSIAARFKR